MDSENGKGSPEESPVDGVENEKSRSVEGVTAGVDEHQRHGSVRVVNLEIGLNSVTLRTFSN